jgi:hypothetical protein
MALGTSMWPPMAKANVTAGLTWPPETSAAIRTAAKSPNAYATAVATRGEALLVTSGIISIPANTHIPNAVARRSDRKPSIITILY